MWKQHTRPKTASEQQKQRRRRRVVGRAISALIAAALLTGLVVAFIPNPLPVDVAQVRRGTLRAEVRGDGQTRVVQRYVVSAPVGASLSRITLRPGDRVEPGSTLAVLMPVSSPLLDPRTTAEAQSRLAAALDTAQQARAAVQRARLAYDSARREAARQRELQSAGAASRVALENAEVEQNVRAEELASSELGARVAEHQVELAKAALSRATGKEGAGDRLEVTSPIDGQVLRVLQESAGVVAPGAPLLEVGDPRDLEVVVDVLTTDASRIRRGAPVTLERWGGPPIQGRVRLVEPSAFTRVSALGVEEQRVNVVIDLTDVSERSAGLGDGYRIEARIIVAELQDVLMVPDSAVFRRGEGWSVFAIDGGRAQLRAVGLGERTGVDAEVRSGLRQGERVIAYPSERIRDGVRVEEREQ